MAYTDFDLELVESELGVAQRLGPIFPDLPDIAGPAWLADQLARGMELAPMSEKARSEFIVAPILLAVRELTGKRVAILSGHRLNVDQARKLDGECDFLLSLSEPLPRVRPPLLVVVQARHHDIDGGLGQCSAQMFAARIYNERASEGGRPVYGCVTTGDDWQFLRLDATELVIDPSRRYIVRIGSILATLLATVGFGPPG